MPVKVEVHRPDLVRSDNLAAARRAVQALADREQCEVEIVSRGDGGAPIARLIATPRPRRVD
jgi:hypothetical protein